jgi:predicted nucleic acid-binding protein
MVEIDTGISLLAAQLRGQYGLKLPDALQMATAIRGGYEAFLA